MDAVIVSPIAKWTETAQRRSEDDLLARIMASPLHARFHGRAGISVLFSRFEYTHFFNFDSSDNFSRCHSLAMGLAARGLVEVCALGSATFDVTTLPAAVAA